MPGNANFDQLLTTTLKHWVETKLVDNIFGARVLFYSLQDAGQVKIKSGAKIIEPLMYAANGTQGSYSGYDTISLTAAQINSFTAAEFDWKQYACSIAINGLEEAQNSSEDQIIDLLEAKIMQAEESIADGMNTMFFGDGTGNSSKDYLGLQALVANNSIGVASTGGIDGATETFWRSYSEATAAALTIAHMTTAYNSVAVGSDQPNLVLTTQTLFERYESLLQPQLRFSDTKVGDAGFQNLMFKGAPVTFDTACTAGRVYFLNTKYLKLVGHSDKWFATTEFVKPRDQDAKFAQILCYGNLIISNRKRQGVLTAKTA